MKKTLCNNVLDLSKKLQCYTEIARNVRTISLEL